MFFLIYDPTTGTATGAGRTPLAGNRVPDSRISPLAKKILALLPSPTLPGTGINYEYNSMLVKTTDSFDAKVDHNWTDNDRLSVRYSFQRRQSSIWRIQAGRNGEMGR
jgi:hypothetical protein